MSKRHKHRHRPDLREVMEDFDWQAERDAALEDETTDNVQPILKVVQAEGPGRDEALKELELAKTRVTELKLAAASAGPRGALSCG